MLKRLKELIARRDFLAVVATFHPHKYSDIHFHNEVETVCAEILEISNSIYYEKERAVIEWDGLEKGAFIGDSLDLVLDNLVNEVNRN